MLTYRGKLYDLTVACFDENDFMVFGSGAAQEMYRRWFESHINKFNLSYKNRSDEFHGLSIPGHDLENNTKNNKRWRFKCKTKI